MEIMNMKIKLMATLWENTYRVMVEDPESNYIATVRVIVNLPLDKELLPENAPSVEAQLLALVEDSILSSSEIISFETTFSALLREKFQYQIPNVFFFYPSPEDMLNKPH